MEINVSAIKQRLGIIGFDPELDRAIGIAVQVAPTDLSVLITGESGVGKENFPKIIHEYSPRKHGPYIAVNCGAIPEGTIDSELFGHVKGAFTSATEDHKGYFEMADKGTLFLDEVGDLPLSTQVRLLRVLESGEFMRVGSSKVQKTDVRVVSATNINLANHIAKGKFREDLFYRLNTVPISVPALRQRKGDIFLLFTKFASDFAEKYHFPQITLTEGAKQALINYTWPGNVRQLKNVTEQMSLIEKNRQIDEVTIAKYLISPTPSQLPALLPSESSHHEQFERELIFKVLSDMKREVAELRELVHHVIAGDLKPAELQQDLQQIRPVNVPQISYDFPQEEGSISISKDNIDKSEPFQESEIIEDTKYSLVENEKDMIVKALKKHNNKRAAAAQELGISERTLYRKIKEMGVMILLLCLTLTGCRMTVSLTGGNIDPRAKTVYVQTFTNNSSLVNPTLSQSFTNALKDRIQNQTPLTIINNGSGDYSLEGEITNYTITPIAIQGNDAAAMNRLTITVRVRFSNSFDDKQDFDQTFSRYADYSSSDNFTAIENTLVTDINDALTEDIFNKAFVNW